MNYFETLEQKRSYVMFYSDKRLIENLLNKHYTKPWKTTLGKNNAMGLSSISMGC